MTNWRLVISGIGFRRWMALHVGGCSSFISICMFRFVHPAPPFSGDGIGFMGAGFTEIFFALLIPFPRQLRLGDDLWRFVMTEGDLGWLWLFYVCSFLCLFVSVFLTRSVIVSFSGLFFRLLVWSRSVYDMADVLSYQIKSSSMRQNLVEMGYPISFVFPFVSWVAVSGFRPVVNPEFVRLLFGFGPV